MKTFGMVLAMVLVAGCGLAYGLDYPGQLVEVSAALCDGGRTVVALDYVMNHETMARIVFQGPPQATRPLLKIEFPLVGSGPRRAFVPTASGWAPTDFDAFVERYPDPCLIMAGAEA
jgi:hypothetical protein